MTKQPHKIHLLPAVEPTTIVPPHKRYDDAITRGSRPLPPGRRFGFEKDVSEEGEEQEHMKKERR